MKRSTGRSITRTLILAQRLQYKAAVARALILDAKGERLADQRYAKLALDAASKAHSGFRHHVKLGLVDEVVADVHRRIKQLAND